MELTPPLLGHLISAPAPLISEHEPLRDLGSLVPLEKPLSTAGPCAQDRRSKDKPGHPPHNHRGWGAFWGFSQWAPIPLSWRARRLPEDLLWLQTFPSLTAPNSPGSACPGLYVERYLDVTSLISQTCAAPPDKLLGHSAWKHLLQPRGAQRF